MNRGFVSVATVAIIGLVSVVVAGGSFGAYKYTQIAKEKTEMERQLVELKDKEIAQLREELVAPKTEDTSSFSEDFEEELEEEETTEDASSPEPEVREVVRTVTEYVPVATPAPKSQITEPEPEVQSTEIEPLKILNVETSEFGDSTYIAWRTNIDSDSRIVIQEDFYVSDNDNSTEHTVTFSDLPRSSIINYEIVAEAGDQEVNKFGKFSTPEGDLEARFGYSNNDECIVVIIEDKSDNAIAGIPLKISSHFYAPNGQRFMNDTLTQSTTAWGEVEYCESNIDDIRVQNTNTYEDYYNGSLPLSW